MANYNYCAYIMANKDHVTLYIGMSKDVTRRVSEHRAGMDKKSFTYKYHLATLIYYEHHTDVNTAIVQEKRLKRWE